MSEYKVGDRVEMIEDQSLAKKGMTGTIIELWASACPKGHAVRFDKKFYGGHDCRSLTKANKARCEHGYGHFISPGNMKLIPSENQQIIIFTKGNQTIAILKEGKIEVRRAVAKCNPSDEFILGIGATLALNRLFGNREDQLRILISETEMCLESTKKELASLRG